ncbi:MAG: hypothetical protein IT238_00175 [Bacteroidia bacterium]|nr:hypothetical protein [Bacteroidia bacterium]MCZ2249656.1 hypothetical protein [Bacteroidia bacterium]
MVYPGIVKISITLTIITVFLLSCPENLYQNIKNSLSNSEIDSLEYAPGHPKVNISALDQLRSFPNPQFKENHGLLPNFLWMDPLYLGGLLQKGYKIKDCYSLSTMIQSELAYHWNYYFLVSNNLKQYKNYRDSSSIGLWVNYANKHPELPTAAISFWAQVQPVKSGIIGCDSKYPFVTNHQLPDSCYLHDSNGKLLDKKYSSPITSISSLKCDFLTQSMYVDSLLSALKRPLQMINDNGEVFRLYDDKMLSQDKRVVSDKNKYPDLSWNEYQAKKRLEKELAFRNSFMNKAPLANCLYTVYAIDGQNKFRHDYKIVRESNSKINNQYYSTPDFYPRYPDNWKTWKGPWHGLKWLEISRKTEIDLGDNLFSPFVAAGWDSVETNNIRPAQWLGLLKLLGAMGAEFYYTGFFNTGKHVAIPENYVWQAVIPAYAQAITSFYEEILRQGKITNTNEIIQYPESDVPVVIRKMNQKKVWLIACTWQTGTNYNKGIGFEKNISVNLGHKSINVKARRQGSVYIYSEEDKPVFYQLDQWHEYKHPYYWSKNVILEAELYSQNIITQSKSSNDYIDYTTAAVIDSSLNIAFTANGNLKKGSKIILSMSCPINEGELNIKLNDFNLGKIPVKKHSNFSSYQIVLKENINLINSRKCNLYFSNSGKEKIWLDKVSITVE